MVGATEGGEASSPPPHSTTMGPTTPYFFPVSLPNPVQSFRANKYIKIFSGDQFCQTWFTSPLFKDLLSASSGSIMKLQPSFCFLLV